MSPWEIANPGALLMPIDFYNQYLLATNKHPDVYVGGFSCILKGIEVLCSCPEENQYYRADYQVPQRGRSRGFGC
jgi:hypothetical protein